MTLGLREEGVFPFTRSRSCSSHSPRSMLLISRCSLSRCSSSALIWLTTSVRHVQYSFSSSLGIRYSYFSDSCTLGNVGPVAFLFLGFSPFWASLSPFCSNSISLLRRSR